MTKPALSERHAKPLRPIAWWILFAALCNCAGWGLSSLHQLNVLGYSTAFGLALVVVFVFRPQILSTGRPLVNLPKLRRRFRRLFPAAFLMLASLAALGGVLHAPANVDAMVQRIPRVLNWLVDERWYWIPKVFGAFNSHACGVEWLMAPMMAFLKTDRWIFLYNVISYLFMPGLIFSSLTRLGVRTRVAWHWMWLAPTGYCFLMQAGGIGNDALGAVLALAALDFALRAKTTRALSDVWLSMLAIGLTTAFKTSNLTLPLPWLIAVWPSLGLLKRHILPTVVVGLISLAASFLPVAVNNQVHCGDWSGAHNELGAEGGHGSPGVTFAGNALNLAAQNLAPPVFPAAAWWNLHAYKVLPAALVSALERGFESPGSHIELQELQWETSAGLGMGVTALLLLSWLLARCRPGRQAGRGKDGWWTDLVRWSPWVCLFVFMVKLPFGASARIIAPYYCLLLPFFLYGQGHIQLIRQTWWRGCAIAVFLLALMMVVINPPRPLWPARHVFAQLTAWRPQSRVFKLGEMLYHAQAVRWDALADVRSALPPQEKNIGFIPFMVTASLETSLWRPFFERRIRWVNLDEDLGTITRQGIRYVVIDTDSLTTSKGGQQFQDWFDAWLRSHQGKIVKETRVPNSATKPPYYWYVVELPSADPAAQAP